MADDKQRHIIVSVYLGLVICANMLFAVLALMGAAKGEPLRGYQPGFLWVVSVWSLVHVVLALALVNWKRWGFYGFCASAGLGLIFDAFAGVGVARALFENVIGLAIMFGVLQIGGTWSRLE